MKWDVLVVGAGPAGSFTAEKIAGGGFSVLLVEENDQVGEPVQCAGLISPRAMDLAGVDNSIIINKASGLRVFSALGANLHAENGRIYSFAIDRAAFDRRLAQKAANAGAVLLQGTKVTGLERITGGYRAVALRNGRTFNIKAAVVIGADGSNSKVAQCLGLESNNPKAVMYAAEVELPRHNTSTIDVFLGRDLAPGWFGWLIPLDGNRCRVGTGYAFVKPKNPIGYYFDKMVNSYPALFRGIKIIRYTGGVVPLGSRPKIVAPHAMLVGDAACQTKPISGGGIYTGLRAAQLCAETAVEALIEDNLTETRLARYQESWIQEMGEELSCSMSYRKNFLDFSDKDIDTLIRFLNKPKWIKAILKYGDIDYPSFLASKLWLLHPFVKTFFCRVNNITLPYPHRST